MPSVDLNALRRRLKNHRRQLSLHTQQQHAHQTVNRIVRHPFFHKARHIALYLPVRGELDVRTLRQYAHRTQRFYLPILAPLSHQGLLFIEWQRNTAFTYNRFHIPEPAYHPALCKPATQLDLVITPLLAADPLGNRLGMGGGFYDRTFAFKAKQHRHHRPPILLGVCYPFQQQTALPTQPWDVPLDALATSEQIKVF